MEIREIVTIAVGWTLVQDVAKRTWTLRMTFEGYPTPEHASQFKDLVMAKLAEVDFKKFLAHGKH